MNPGNQVKVKTCGLLFSATIKRISKVTGLLTVTLDHDYKAYRKGEEMHVKQWECEIVPRPARTK